MSVIGVDLDTKSIIMVEIGLLGPKWIGGILAKGRRAEDRIEKLAFTLITFKIPKVDWVYIETPIMGVNARALRDQAQVVGMLRYRLWELGLPHSLIDNGTWKKAVIGNGHASKEEIAHFAVGVLGMQNGLSQDTYDAACIAQYGKIATQ